MEDNKVDVNDSFWDEIERMVQDDGQESSPVETNPDSPATQPVEETNDSDNIENTKAFAKRLNERTTKAVSEERETIAKMMGFESYDQMVKSKEKKYIEDKGFDPEEVSPIVDKLVQDRLNNDPRMKELEKFRAKEVEEFGKRELSEITKLTGGEITSLAQLPKEVIELWKQTGSLKKAYLQIEGENLITKMRSEQSRGSTSHLANPSGNGKSGDGKRHLTEAEKQAWRVFKPGISEDELNQKLVKD